jgi:hypothetical protein
MVVRKKIYRIFINFLKINFLQQPWADNFFLALSLKRSVYPGEP